MSHRLDVARAAHGRPDALYVNLARIPFLLTENDLARMAGEVADWAPVFLDMDPVHGVRFALYCERQAIQFPTLKFIFVQLSEFIISVVHRRILARVFKVPVFNLYGSTETGHLLMETTSGEMKPVYETALLELADTDERGIGALVVTTLTNEFMPLLRYCIGDLRAKNSESPYGTHYIAIHGRVRDVLRSRDGQVVTTWQVDQCLAGMDGIAHYELRQPTRATASFRFVPDAQPPTWSQLKELAARLGDLLGFGVNFEAMNTVVPAASGKFSLTAASFRAKEEVV